MQTFAKLRWALFALLFPLLPVSPVLAADLLTYGSGGWKYFIGTQEASSPVDAWRLAGFNDTTWSPGTAPIGYANPPNDPGGFEATIVTLLPASSSVPNWTSVYFRRVL